MHTITVTCLNHILLLFSTGAFTMVTTISQWMNTAIGDGLYIHQKNEPCLPLHENLAVCSNLLIVVTFLLPSLVVTNYNTIQLMTKLDNTLLLTNHN